MTQNPPKQICRLQRNKGTLSSAFFNGGEGEGATEKEQNLGGGGGKKIRGEA